MKKIVVFSAVLLFFACKKDEFQDSIDGLTPVSLPSELIGNWRYLYTQGGWGGIVRDSTITGNVLTIESNQTFKWCKQDVCSTGKWFYGSRPTKSATFRDTMLVFEMPKPQTNFPIVFANRPYLYSDTLYINFLCNDCSSPVFVKVK